MSSCCVADTISISPQLLADHATNIFNIPQLVDEREQMLAGKPVASCKRACWDVEAAGLPSTRLTRQTNKCTHTNVNADVEMLHIVLGTDCNLTCSYCCKQYSTAWLHDIKNNGPYLNEDRYMLNVDDNIVLKLGQKSIKASSIYQNILGAVINLPTITRVQITGGEPFLYNGLPDLLGKLTAHVELFTGLGVSSSRFKRIIEQLPKQNLTLVISAENTGALYEFNRNGNTYENFLKNLDTIRQAGIDYHFALVISNTTLPGLKQFQDEFGTARDFVNVCQDPVYLSPAVLDSESKKIINETVYKYHDAAIKQAVNGQYTQQDKQNLITYINEFARRRSLDMSIFPAHFVDWLNEDN